MISPAHSENYDESDYNGESTLFVEWREKVTNLAQKVGKKVGFQNVVINVFANWGYVDSIGTVRLSMNGCQYIHHWSDSVVARFKSEEPETLLTELLEELLEPASEATKQEASRKQQIRIKEESERKEALEQEARKEAESAQKIEQYKALTPEQVKADWAAKVAAAKAAAEKESKRPISRYRNRRSDR